jgi:WD40 repeat protein
MSISRPRVTLSVLLLGLLSSCFGTPSTEPSEAQKDIRWKKWAQKTQEPSKEIALEDHTIVGPSLRFTVSEDRQKAMYVSYGCEPDYSATIEVISLVTGEHLASHPWSGAGFAFSPDGTKALVCGPDDPFDTKKELQGNRENSVRLWDLPSGKELGLVKVRTRMFRDVAWSPTGKLAIVGGDSGTILLLNVEKMEVLKKFVGHTSGIRCLVWSRDGKTFLSGSWDSTVRLWDVQTGKEVANLLAPYGRVMSIALSPNGKYALSSYVNGPNQPIIFWDVETQKEINRFGIPHDYVAGDQLLHAESVVFSPDGKTALFGLVFGTVIWWDLNEWKQIAYNRLYADQLSFVTFSQNGGSCIAVGCDEDAKYAVVRMWQLPISQKVAEDELGDKQQHRAATSVKAL